LIYDCWCVIGVILCTYTNYFIQVNELIPEAYVLGAIIAFRHQLHHTNVVSLHLCFIGNNEVGISPCRKSGRTSSTDLSDASRYLLGTDFMSRIIVFVALDRSGAEFLLCSLLVG
jgi:hypothetical protein